MTLSSFGQSTRPLQQCSSSRWLVGASQVSTRQSSTLKRQRRDDFWIPTISLKKQNEPLDTTELLTRAGYLRQAYSGIFHMLPLGLRVQDKLEKLIDKHMTSIRASKVSLSSISSQSLWDRSGRLNTGSEFFKFTDRKDARWLLAPTHEEEITSLVSDVVHSPGQLPVRLYQITRKYRDEKRPRGGLLRGREFIMKDLYTFDISQSEAHATYDQVRAAYRNFLADLKVQYIEARADSGNMGGSLSHEYHFPSSGGEDDVIHCKSCDYARNEEWVPGCPHSAERVLNLEGNEALTKKQVMIIETFLDKTRLNLIKSFAPKKTSNNTVVGMNTYAIKAAFDGILELDTGVEQPYKAFVGVLSKSSESGSVYYLFDSSIPETGILAQISEDRQWLADNKLSAFIVRARSGDDSQETAQPDSLGLSLLKQVSGDPCPQCKDGKLQVDKAIEVGHTFHLGTRYSSKLGLIIKPTQKAAEPVPVEMGCHGIGVSRLVAAVASSLSDSTGLNWPASIAPFQVVIVVDGNDTEKKEVAERLYDATIGSSAQDILLDDRSSVNNGYKLKDADLIGYPIIAIVGKTWQQSSQIELQCRRLNVKESVNISEAPTRIAALLERL